MFSIYVIINTSHGETHFRGIMGADAPAAFAVDDHRAYREMCPLPIVTKSGANRF